MSEDQVDREVDALLSAPLETPVEELTIQTVTAKVMFQFDNDEPFELGEIFNEGNFEMHVQHPHISGERNEIMFHNADNSKLFKLYVQKL